MTGYVKILIILSFLFVASGYAQGNLQANPAKQDTLKNKSSISIYNLIDQPYSNNYDLYNHKLSLDKMYKLYFLHHKRIIIPQNYSELDYSSASAAVYGNKSGGEDSLSYFNNNLSAMLALKYKELNKYDLGSFGEYLGLSNTMLAVVLAVLTAVK